MTNSTGPQVLTLDAPLDLPYRFAAAKQGSRAMERAVLRPIDLTATHGLKVRPKTLADLVASYDPSVETAMLNFDHQVGGKSHGHCVRLWMEGDLLWSRFERLSPEAVHGVESGEWPRCSSEYLPTHPVLKVPYYIGLALLGAKSPAVTGLGEAKLLERPVYRLITFDSESRTDTAVQAAPATGEETTEESMKTKTEETPAGAEPKTPPATPTAPAAPAAPGTPGTPAAPATSDAAATEVAQLSAQVQSEIAKLQGDRATLATQLTAIRLERAEVAADKLLSTKLEKRLTPAQARLARPLLVALLALPEGDAQGAVKLASDGGKVVDVPIVDRIVQIFEAGPDHSNLFHRVANGDPKEVSAVALTEAEKQAGMTPEEAARLEAKYPNSFLEN
jgi:hypothetical protein